VDRDELRRILDARGVRRSAYSLDSGVANEAFCMERSRGGWSVYFFERGNRNAERWFLAEADACRDLLRRVAGDPTTGRRAG